MIDTDKYKGHKVSDFKTSVAGPKHSWVTYHHSAGAIEYLFVNHATAALITDAPKLLAEVKRLREAIKNIVTGAETNGNTWTFEILWEMREELKKVIE